MFFYRISLFITHLTISSIFILSPAFSANKSELSYAISFAENLFPECKPMSFSGQSKIYNKYTESELGICKKNKLDLSALSDEYIKYKSNDRQNMINLSILLKYKEMYDEALSAATESFLCRGLTELETSLAPYTDESIKAIIIRSGKEATSDEILDKYNKICIEYNGSIEWLGEGECKGINGTIFCGFDPLNSKSPEVLCARVSQYCPCTINVQNGTLEKPEYEVDENGSVKIDSEGNFIIKNQEMYFARAGKHCRTIKSAKTADLSTGLYNDSYSNETIAYDNRGIIDDVCRTWNGYSKNSISITSGLVQCIENSARNIFEKPIGIFKSNVLNADSNSELMFKNFASDIELLSALKQKVIALKSYNYPGLYDDSKVQDVHSVAYGINDRSAFNKSTRDVYKGMVSVVNLQNPISDSVAINNNNEIEKLEKEISGLIAEAYKARKNFFVSSLEINTNSVFLTPFSSVQGSMAVFISIMLIMYVMLIGFRMMNGGFSVKLSSVWPILFQLSIVYYFSIGTAWKDYFFNMILSVSKGFGAFFLEVATDHNPMNDRCDFSKVYYIPKEGEKCDSLNPTTGSRDPSPVTYDRVNKKDIYGCIKGPAIVRPNYETVYRPVKFSTRNAFGENTTEVLQVYCVDKAGGSVPADLIMSKSGYDAIEFRCKDGYTMEDGYRSSELAKIGISASSSNKFGLINTSFFISNSDGAKINVYAPGKEKTIKEIEKNRNSVNKNRNYPIIEQYSGVYRDMSYVSLFDTLDCKMMRYFRYNPENKPDILSMSFVLDVIFTGPIGISVAIMAIIMSFFIIGMIMRIVQGYVISIIAITLLVFLSPLVIPLCLFPETKKFFNAWLGQIIKYATGLPFLYLTLGIVIFIADYAIYGDPRKYDYFGVFDINGYVNEDCGKNDPENAPLICLVQLLKPKMKQFSFITLPLPDINSEYFKLVVIGLWAMIKATFIFYMLFEMISKIEGMLDTIFGSKQDTSINGSIFNSASGPYRHLRARAESTLESAKSLATDASQSVQDAARSGVGGIKSVGKDAGSALSGIAGGDKSSDKGDGSKLRSGINIAKSLTKD